MNVFYKIPLVFVFVGCTPELDIDVEAFGMVCTETSCTTCLAITDTGIVVTAGHLFSHSGIKPRKGEYVDVEIEWLPSLFDESRSPTKQRVKILLARYERYFDLVLFQAEQYPDTHVPLCEDTLLFKAATLFAIVDGNIDTASGYITAVSPHNYMARMQSEPGYSGAPIIADGCVMGIHTLSKWGWSYGMRVEVLNQALQTVFFGDGLGMGNRGIEYRQR